MTFSGIDSALTGPLLASEPMRAVFADRARIEAMLAVEGALARALALHGLAPEGLADAVAGIDPESLDLDALGRGAALAGVPVIPFVKAVEASLPPEVAAAFHRGATTQDVLDTALVLQVREALGLIEADLALILADLRTLAVAHRTTPCVGRTYGQHAAPTTFGFKAAVWMTGIADAAAALPALRERVLAASLGGPVGTLAGLGLKGPAVLDAFAADLGLRSPGLAWHALRGRVAETGAWLAGLIGALAKMAGDVAHLASTEVGEVAEPHQPGRGGSSAMPHKRNPVSSTVILAAHAAAGGHAAALFAAMAAAHERPAGAWHGEWHALPTLFGLASGALKEARALAEGLEVDAARCRANLDLTRGLLFADAAAARLAHGLGRERAHALVEEAASLVRRGEAGDLREALALDADAASADLDAAFDLAPAVEAAAAWVDRALQASSPAAAHPAPTSE